MNRLSLVASPILSLVLTFGATCASALATDDPKPAPPMAQKRFDVVKDPQGVWWFQGPDGKRMYSIAVNNVTPEPFMPRAGTTFYNPVPGEFIGDTQAWADYAAGLLKDHGFNTLGAWSSTAFGSKQALPHTPVLYVVEHEGTRCLSPLRADFESYVLKNVQDAIKKLPERQLILGVFLDNEMPWYGKSGWDDIPTFTLLEQAMDLPAADKRRIAAIEFLKSRHGSCENLSAAYHRTLNRWEDLTMSFLTGCTAPEAMADRTAFTEMLANRFYEVTTRIVRQELPGVLILGTRIPGNAPDAVIRACGKHCDVMSLNQYAIDTKPDEDTLTRFWVLGGKPIMHTEFSWRAAQNSSGVPNTRGAGVVVQTQAERAKAYASYVADIATVPYVIASHWFEFADQSPQGRFDGEDSNYGIVDIHNKPYPELLSAMKATNAQVHDLHAKTKRIMPSELPQPQAVTYSPGQHPDRAPTLSLLGEWIHEPEIWGAPDSKLAWKRQNSALVLTYDAGTQYGAGINLFGPKTSALKVGPKHASDLDGYSTFVLQARVPKGVQLNIVLAEAAAHPPSIAEFDSAAGDDGEAFISSPVYGTGEIETYRIPIAKLLRQQFFGNQRGARKVDMQAIRNVGLQVSGEPRTGDVVIQSFQLQR